MDLQTKLLKVDPEEEDGLSVVQEYLDSGWGYVECVSLRSGDLLFVLERFPEFIGGEDDEGDY